MIHPSVSCVLAAALATTVAPAQPVIYATRQILISGDPDLSSTDPGHYDTIESYIYPIDLLSGLATPISRHRSAPSTSLMFPHTSDYSDPVAPDQELLTLSTRAACARLAAGTDTCSGGKCARLIQSDWNAGVLYLFSVSQDSDRYCRFKNEVIAPKGFEP